nr:DUF5990 family protein [Paludisphaera soli]
MNVELRLRIVLESPPAGVDFGLQLGKGSDYETIETQRSQGTTSASMARSRRRATVASTRRPSSAP